MESDNFHRWLFETVEFHSFPIERWRVIDKFVCEGLMPWIEKHGYIWSCSQKDLRNRIATGLFENEGKTHLQSEWRYGVKEENTDEEELSHFHHVLGSAKWELFWSYWGKWSDLEDFRGQDRMLDIQNFVWSQLDWFNSPQTRELIEILHEDSYEEVPQQQRRTGATLEAYESYD